MRPNLQFNNQVQKLLCQMKNYKKTKTENVPTMKQLGNF